MSVDNGYISKIPFDLEHWQKIADETYPDGLPEPYSDDPTQWLFHGHPAPSTAPLQVAVARLLGYRWPAESDEDMELSDDARAWISRCSDLDPFTDEDGIACLPPVAGERPAAERVRALLAKAYGEEWSQGLLDRLISDAGSPGKDLAAWLRDDFFKQHCRLFHNRPFVWHIWDGRKDGFSALVNYHGLDRARLEKLTYRYLGSWIEAQGAAASAGERGADLRLAAARELRAKLEAILEGEPPYDVYVRWKGKHEQPIGWQPDLNDGVRLNVRPFVEAGVLRSKFTINWKKDRGKNPDGSERHNDLHLTRAEKEEARRKAGIVAG
ncbi:MAG: BREX-1 system adenine-specific DNA-methyltransferase PglX [Actinomycetota bacterium]|nr:BREX-1 system adenine-specific DNA-methyltransferase PglX [Actinomycetota bacterium]